MRHQKKHLCFLTENTFIYAQKQGSMILVHNKILVLRKTQSFINMHPFYFYFFFS